MEYDPVTSSTAKQSLRKTRRTQLARKRPEFQRSFPPSVVTSRRFLKVTIAITTEAPTPKKTHFFGNKVDHHPNDGHVMVIPNIHVQRMGTFQNQ